MIRCCNMQAVERGELACPWGWKRVWSHDPLLGKPAEIDLFGHGLSLPL
jgi:hypothetical protein